MSWGNALKVPTTIQHELIAFTVKPGKINKLLFFVKLSIKIGLEWTLKAVKGHRSTEPAISQDALRS